MDMISNNPTIQKYEKLMYKIATSFGFSNSESCDLVRQVSFPANSHYADHENRFVLRILLSKIIVHKCIFRISNRLFSQSAGDKKEPGVLVCYSDSKNSYVSTYQDIPLSFRVVYILTHTIGFNEIEIAEILNTTSIKAKDRFNKAKSLLNQ